MRAKQNIIFFALVVLLSLISIVLHLYKFPEIPNGFFYDEASLTYNSYCISKTGADEYARPYPLFFTCFDNFQDPVYVYSLIPVIKLFGLEKWTARSLGIFFLFIASFSTYFFARKILSDRWGALFCAFTFSILPWTFVISRTGVGGYMPMLLGITSASYFLLMSMSKKSMKYAILAGLTWAFTMYSHQIGRPMTVLLLFTFFLSFYFFILKRWKIFLLFISTLLLSLVPMIIYVFSTPDSMTKRFATFSIWRDGAGLIEVLERFFSRYIEYFSPNFLFLIGDSDLRHNTNSSGELYLIMAPLIIFGLYNAIKHWRRPAYRFILFAIIVYPIAASLTVDRMHSTRCLNGAPFFCVLAGLGLKSVYAFARKKNIVSICNILLISILTIEAYYYFLNYFGNYVDASRTSFNAPLVETLEFAFKEKRHHETIYISDSLFHHPVTGDFKPVWYSHFLFFGKIDPATYQQKGIPPEIVSHYKVGGDIKHGLLLRMNSKIIFDEKYRASVVFNDETIPKGAKLISKIPLLKGSDRFFEVYRIYEK